MDEQQLTQYAELAAAAAERAEKATEGPWRNQDGVSRFVSAFANAAFIAASRQDVPALAAAVTALVEEVEKLRQVIEIVDEWEWDTLEEFYYCHWCGNNKNYGHASDCPRQEALRGEQ